MNLINLLLNNNSKIIDCSTNIEYGADYINMKSNSMAAFLKSRGLSRDSRVAISIKNSIEFVIAFIGTLKFGATPLLFNPRWPDFYLDNIEYDFFVDSEIVKSLSNQSFDMGSISDFFILYTSGSATLPKSVKIGTKEHFNLIKSKSSILSNSIRKIIMIPLCHMSALSNIEISLSAGQTIILMEKFNSKALNQNIIKHNANQIHAIPSHMRIFLDNDDERYLKIKSILLGAEATDLQLYKRLKEKFPNAYISVAYGSTELGPNLFIKHPYGLKTPETSVGYPNPDIQYRIVNGILEVKSPYMMKGYANSKNSFTSDGFFITNDLFEIDENGFYYCLGSSNESFKSGGNKIIPSTIESVLKMYDKIQNAVVIDTPDDQKGKIPIAFYTSKNTIDQNDLLKFCQQFLMPFQLPKKLIRVAELPINSTGKIDKKLLRELYET